MSKCDRICGAPILSIGAFVTCLCGIAAYGQGQAGSPTATPLITQQVSSQMQALTGHVRPGLSALPDLGAVNDSQLFGLHLVLQRSPAQQADLQYLIARQQEPTAAEFHRWLTPQQFGKRFGAAQQDIAAISAWLQSQGLQVNGVMNNASFIDFTATAGQIRQIFGAQIHNFSINGATYPAAINEPSVPAALAPAISNIFGLTKIPAHTNLRNPTQVSYNTATHSWNSPNASNSALFFPAFNVGTNHYFVAPQDLYTIYNINNVFNSRGLNDLAATSSVAVIEESDIEFGTVNLTTGAATGGDVATFRSLFGVPGTLNMHVYHGYGSVACNAPGIDPNNLGEDVEAAIDAEWANATAPSANLIFMSCDLVSHNGIFSSLAAVIDNNLADVMSMSYGESELYAPSGLYSTLDTLWAQAATQGQSILVSSGDSGSDVEDQQTGGTATSGINVSALSASPLVTATGGTDFSDYYDALQGGSLQSVYWGQVNSAYYGDALSYVPETAWNDSCANSILANIANSYSGAGLCAQGQRLDLVGGSGGFSTHYSVPAYQSAILGYSGAQRAQPDIAGFASDLFWNHALLFCDSYRRSYSCTILPNTFGVAGGTSFVAPYMAGVTALLDTHTGSRQGLLNPALYALAKAQFTSPSTSTACYANGQTSNVGVTAGLPNSSCTFNDITTGNNDMPCQSGSLSCYVNAGASYGMLSLTGSSSLSIAYPSAPGYDETTGLGSINVYNLLSNWSNAFTSSTGLEATPTSVSPGVSTTLAATVTGGVPADYSSAAPAVTGTVDFYDGANLIGNCILSAGYCSTSVSSTSLQAGSNSITAEYLGNRTYPSSTSTIQTVTLTLTPQTVTFVNLPTQAAAGTSITLSASANTPVTFSSPSSASICSVSGSTLTFNGVGTCTVTATAAQTSVYQSATTSQNIAVLLGQTITFGSIPVQIVGIPLALSATATSGLTVAFASTTTGICTVSGTAATFVTPGTCTIVASQSGNSTYIAANPVSQSFTVQAEPGLGFIPVTPCRVVDTRGSTSALGGPTMLAGSTRSFPLPTGSCNLPSTAAAYSLNVTVVPNKTLQYLSLWRTGQSQPLVSTLNSFDGRIVANAAIVPAGTAGEINVYVTDQTDVIIDVDGYFASAGTAGALTFVPVTPCRVEDTRSAVGPLGGPTLSAGSSRSFPVPSSACSVPSTAAAYSLNATVVPATTLGYLTLYPTGQAQPYVSTLNSYNGQVVANAAIVPAGTGGAITAYVTDQTDLITDINGYFTATPATPLVFNTVTPCRVADTRNANGTFGGPIMAAGSTRSFPIPTSTCGIPASAAAYALNITVVPTSTLGYLTLWRAGQTQPVVSTLNSYNGQVVANAALVPAGSNGAVDVFVTDLTHVIIDIVGYFSAP